MKNRVSTNRAPFLILLAVVLAAVMSLNISVYAGTKNAIHVSIDGKTLESGAIQSEDNLFLPLRAVCESMGYKVEWSGTDRSVTASNPNKTVSFESKNDTVDDGGHSYYVNGRYNADNYIGGGCMLVDSRIYVASDLMESCFGLKQTYNQSTNTCELTVKTEGAVKSENKTLHSEDAKLVSNIQYPYFSMTDKAVADKINAVILADVEASQKEAQDNLKAYEGSQSPNKSETYFNYRIAYEQGNFLSVVLLDYQYYGGAHGTTRQITHTFDLTTGGEYSMKDLMKGDSGYVGYINDYIKAKIVKDGLEDSQLVKFESIADNQAYYLSDQGLVIYFQQYEYFPYAAGIMEYDFPFGDLGNYLKPELKLN